MENLNLKDLLNTAITAGKATLKYYNTSLEIITKDDKSPLTQADLESNRVINEYLITTGIPILSEENKVSDFSERKSWKELWVVDPLDGTKEFINARQEFTINIALVKDNEPVFGVIYTPVMKELFWGIKGVGAYKIEATDTLFASEEEINSKAKQLPIYENKNELVVVASKSHLNDETKQIINSLEEENESVTSKSFGSSLKFCRLAEGQAHIYPRMGPTMEWDTAAGHAIAAAADCIVIKYPEKTPLVYNKENTLNPYFIAVNKDYLSLLK